MWTIIIIILGLYFLGMLTGFGVYLSVRKKKKLALLAEQKRQEEEEARLKEERIKKMLEAVARQESERKAAAEAAAKKRAEEEAKRKADFEAYCREEEKKKKERHKRIHAIWSASTMPDSYKVLGISSRTDDDTTKYFAFVQDNITPESFKICEVSQEDYEMYKGFTLEGRTHIPSTFGRQGRWLDNDDWENYFTING